MKCGKHSKYIFIYKKQKKKEIGSKKNSYIWALNY